jgi:hypothetical protein
MIPIYLLALLLLGACAPAEPPMDSIPSTNAAAEVVRGTVRIVGSAPMNVQVVLRPEEGGSIRIVGPLLPEIQRLSGIQLAVTGPIGPAPDPMADRQIEATGYEIIAVDGQPVVMGEITSISGSSARLRTSRGEEVTLSGVPASFRVGQKVWVQGPENIVVQTFGTIRP